MIPNSPEFLPLTWREGYAIHENTQEPISPNEFVYDIRARVPGGNYDPESQTYVELGYFTDSNSYDYYMVVNRRALVTDTRQIEITFRVNPNSGNTITNMFTDVETPYPRSEVGSDGQFTYNATIEPGGGQLLRLDRSPEAPRNLQITNPSSQWANPILLWDANSEPDLDHYLVWRGTTPNWKTIPITWETSSAANVTGTTWTDNLTRMDQNTLNSTYYRVTAVDVANNESDFSSAIGTTSSPIMRPILEDETTALQDPETVLLSDDKTVSLPQSIALAANHPNPFNPETRIEYELSEAAAVTITIYNLVGQQITTLVNEPKGAGFFSVMWDGRDATGAQVGSGVYIYRLSVKPANGGSRPFVQSRKMVLVR